MKIAFRFLAPYLAVALCWFGLSNAWLAVIAYHGQILLYARGRIPPPRLPVHRRFLLFALPVLFVGPLVYALLPALAGDGLATWLQQRRVSSSMLLLFLPYFGLVHPWLEQLHWSPLRQHTRFAHPLFAGYHVMVLITLTSWPWLMLVFVSLALVSFSWERLTSRANSLVPAYVSHAIADIGIVFAAFMRT